MLAGRDRRQESLSRLFDERVDVPPQHHGLAAETALAHPMCERRIEVVRMSREPTGEGSGEAPGLGVVTQRDMLPHLFQRTHDGRVLVHVAFACREGGRCHPGILSGEVFSYVIGEQPKCILHGFVGRPTQCPNKTDKLFMNMIYGRMAEQESIVPGERLRVDLGHSSELPDTI